MVKRRAREQPGEGGQASAAFEEGRMGGWIRRRKIARWGAGGRATPRSLRFRHPIFPGAGVGRISSEISGRGAWRFSRAVRREDPGGG